jgi:hypothetical protein
MGLLQLPDSFLSEQNIYAKVSELQLFTYALGFTPDLGKVFSSPLREDKKPSFNVFENKRMKPGANQLLFKDFATGECGNVIKFIGMMNNTTYYQTLDLINKTFNLGLFKLGRCIKVLEEQIGVERARQEIRKPIHSNVVLEGELREFIDQDLRYFSSYGIDLELLNAFDVVPLKNLKINGKLRFQNTGTNPIYAYNFGNSCKIYRPLSPDWRWLSNTNSSCIQGYKQLELRRPTDGLVFITKSLKDVMTLARLGFYSVAPNSETVNIPEWLVKDLKNKFGRVVLLYDNDNTGIQRSAIEAERHGLERIFMPKKDVSDTFKVYGMDTLSILQKAI